jgi:hypothetical protein
MTSFRCRALQSLAITISARTASSQTRPVALRPSAAAPAGHTSRATARAITMPAADGLTAYDLDDAAGSSTLRVDTPCTYASMMTVESLADAASSLQQ